MKFTLITIMLAHLALEVCAVAAPTPEALYNEGQDAYDVSDYATAIVKWRASYELSGASGLLFNIAQAYRLSGDCKQALSIYRRFISIDPTADERQRADDFVRELESRCGSPKATPVTSHHSTSGRTMKIAALTVSGVGVVSLAIGIGFGRHASTLGDEVTLACSISCDWSAEKDRDASGHRDAILGHALDALGVTAIAGGALMYYLGYLESDVHVTPLTTRPNESGAVITWSTSW